MSKKNSPFAALTSREQQERWLEFQNTRLPYITGEVDTATAADTAQWVGQHIDKAIPPSAAQNRQTNQDAQGRPSPQQRMRNEPSSMDSLQKINHKQYDAVIRRMMEAEKQVTAYQPSIT